MTKNQLDVAIGKNIRKSRIARGISTDELAELIGCTAGSIGLMERGKRGATPLTLSKLSDVFGQSVAEFFSFEDEVPQRKDEAQRKKIFSLVNNFTESELNLVIYVIKGIRQLKR